MTELHFNERRILVVGGSSGIGNCIAQSFRARGATVAVWGTRANAKDYEKENGSNLDGLTYAQVDVSDTKSIANKVLPFEGLDTLVLCQGETLRRRQEFTVEGFERVVRVNLDSLMACAIRFYPSLKDSRGSIVMLTSTAGIRTVAASPGYTAAKTGVLGLVRALGHAWAGDGVRVNAIAPGLVPTKMSSIITDNPARLEAILKTIPAGRIGAPQDIADVTLFLASPLAKYVIGQTIAVDGGLSL